MNPIRFIILKLIRFYQKTLSLDHGLLSHRHPHGFCRFHPTCSEYTYQAIEKHGVIKGSTKGIWRIMKCNPLNQGGHDPLR